MKLKNASSSTLTLQKPRARDTSLLRDFSLASGKEAIVDDEWAYLHRDIRKALADGTLTVSGNDQPANSPARSATYSGAGSYQCTASDLTLAAAAGTSEAGDSDFLGAIMGNLLNDATLTKTGNYLAGVIAHYSVTGAGSGTYPKGALLAGIGDGSTDAKGAVVAYIDGDSGASTKAGAAFKVMHNNSTATNKFDFGVDLFDAAHDGFNAPSYAKAEIRMLGEACIFTKAGAPVDGVSGTGAGFAGPGSLAIDTTNSDAYLNAGTKASPTWKLVTRAA